MLMRGALAPPSSAKSQVATAPFDVRIVADAQRPDHPARVDPVERRRLPVPGRLARRLRLERGQRCRHHVDELRADITVADARDGVVHSRDVVDRNVSHTGTAGEGVHDRVPSGDAAWLVTPDADRARFDRRVDSCDRVRPRRRIESDRAFRRRQTRSEQRRSSDGVDRTVGEERTRIHRADRVEVFELCPFVVRQCAAVVARGVAPLLRLRRSACSARAPSNRQRCNEYSDVSEHFIPLPRASVPRFRPCCRRRRRQCRLRDYAADAPSWSPRRGLIQTGFPSRSSVVPVDFQLT